jgi:hypothetical protein
MEKLNPSVPVAKVQKKEKKTAKKARLFADMTLSEIEAFEIKTNSIVLFDDERGINFQKCKGDGDALAILVDGLRSPILLLENEIDVLRTYLNSNF